MYRKDSSLLAKNSASALSNNLFSYSESGKRSVAFVHKSVVNVMTKQSDGSVNQFQVSCKDVGGNPAHQLTQAKWVTLHSKPLLVLASQKGVQIFEWDGSVFLHWYAFPSDPDSQQLTFARGIGTCGSSLLCVGSHSGTILVFLIPQDGTNITFCQRVREHEAAVTDIHGKGEIMASADDSGNICLWKGKTQLTKIENIVGNGVPCTSVRAWNDLVFASYASGHLRVFSTASYQMMSEVTAHARWVSAIDVADETGLALSASEDSFVRLWQLDRDGDTTIQLICNIPFPDSQLVGATFLTNDGSAFAAVAYDSTEVVCFSQ